MAGTYVGAWTLNSCSVTPALASWLHFNAEPRHAFESAEIFYCPVPFRKTVWGLLLALSLTATFAVLLFGPEGVNVTVMVQLAPLANGRAIRVLSVVDECTRECLTLEVDTSFASRRVTRALEMILTEREKPLAIRCDNGLESFLVSGSVLRATPDEGTLPQTAHVV